MRPVGRDHCEYREKDLTSTAAEVYRFNGLVGPAGGLLSGALGKVPRQPFTFVAQARFAILPGKEIQKNYKLKRQTLNRFRPASLKHETAPN